MFVDYYKPNNIMWYSIFKETESLATSFLPPNSLCTSCLPLKYTTFLIYLILVILCDKSPTKLVMVLLPSVILVLSTVLSFKNHLAVVLWNFLPLMSNMHVSLFTWERSIMPLKLRKHFKISPILHSLPVGTCSYFQDSCFLCHVTTLIYICSFITLPFLPQLSPLSWCWGMFWPSPTNIQT